MKAYNILKQLSAPQPGRGLAVYSLLAMLLCLSMQGGSLAPSGSGGPEQVSLDPLSQRVRQIYTSQVGIREKGPNAGKQVEAYLRYAGLPKGNPWCAAFVCWVYGQAGVENAKTGWSPTLFPASRIVWRREESYVLRVTGYELLQNSRFVLKTKASKDLHKRTSTSTFQPLFNIQRKVSIRRIYSNVNHDYSTCQCLKYVDRFNSLIKLESTCQIEVFTILVRQNVR